MQVVCEGRRPRLRRRRKMEVMRVETRKRSDLEVCVDSEWNDSTIVLDQLSESKKTRNVSHQPTLMIGNLCLSPCFFV